MESMNYDFGYLRPAILKSLPNDYGQLFVNQFLSQHAYADTYPYLAVEEYGVPIQAIRYFLWNLLEQ